MGNWKIENAIKVKSSQVIFFSCICQVYIDFSPKMSQNVTTQVKTVDESILDILFHAIQSDFSFSFVIKP